MNSLIPIRYMGRTLAAASRSRYFLAEDLDEREPEDPERVFVSYMCLYAGLVLNGHVRRTYSDGDARRFARAKLIPAELAERPQVDPIRAAAALGVPVLEFLAAVAEARGCDAR
jgi:hypothetical protein